MPPTPLLLWLDDELVFAALVVVAVPEGDVLKTFPVVVAKSPAALVVGGVVKIKRPVS